MIGNELLDEIINLSLKGILINKKIIEKAFEQIYIDLDTYTQENFQDFRFHKISKERNCRAMCNPIEGKIIFDLETIYKEEKEYGRKDNLSILNQNLNILYTLLHEVEHLKEIYKIYINNFEGKLIKCCQISDVALQQEIYYCDPSEKIAYVDGYQKLLEILRNYPDFQNKYFKEYQYFQNKYVQFHKMGYIYDEFLGKYNVPLLEFLEGTNQRHKFNTLFITKKKKDSNETNISKLNINNRMKYGLPISKKHIEELNKQKILTRGTK